MDDVTPEQIADYDARAEAFNNPKPPEKSSGIMGFIKDNINTTVDIVKGIVSGPTKAVEDTMQLAHDAANWVDNKYLDGAYIDDSTKVNLMDDWWRPESSAGSLAQSLTAMASSWHVGIAKVPSVLGKTAKVTDLLAKAGTTGKAAAGISSAITRSALLSFIHEDAEGGRLADTLADMPMVGEFMPKFLLTDPNDTAMDSRMKNLLQSVFIDTGFKAAGGVFQTLKAAQEVQHLSKGKGFISLEPKVQQQILQKMRDESVEKLLKEHGIDTSVGFSGVMTKEASLIRAREAIQKDGKGVLKSLRETITGHAGKDTGLNAGKYHGEARAFAEAIEDKMKLLNKNNHMNMVEEGAKALDTCLSIGADKLIDAKALNRKILGMDNIRKITTLNVYNEFFLGPKLEIARKNLMEGVPGAEQELREIIKAGYEICAALKNAEFKAGQALKAGDITNVLSKAIMKVKGAVFPSTGREAAKVLSSLTDVVKYADERVSKLSAIELEKMGTELYAARRNGGDIVDIFMANLAADDMLLAGVEKNSLWNTALKYRAAALMSGIGTHVRNLVGNTQKIAILGVEEPVKAMWEGARRNGWKGFKEGAHQGLDYWQGMVYSLPQAFESAGNAWELAQSVSHNSEITELSKKYKLNQSVTGINKYALQPVFKMLAAVDETFAVMAGSGKAHQIVKADLRGSGLLDVAKNKEEAKAIADWFYRDRFGKAMLDVVLPNGQVLKNARFGIQEAADIADSATLQRKLGKWGEGTIKGLHSNPVGQILFPFRRTAMNIMDDVFGQRLLWLPKQLYEASKGDPIKEATFVAHAATAGIMWASAYKLVKEGRIRGGIKNKGVAKDAAYLNNDLPYSVQIGDTWHSMQNLGLAADIMMFMADFAEITNYTDETTIADLSDAALSGLLSVTLDKNYFTGVTQLIRAIENKNAATGFTTDIALSWIPNLATETGRAVDPTIRQARTVMDRTLLKLGLTHSLAPKASWITGEDLTYPHGGGYGTYNPTTPSSPRNDVVYEELEKAWGIGAPSGKVNGQVLTAWDKYEFDKLHGTVKIGGKTMKEALEQLVLSDRYDANRRRSEDDAPNRLNYYRNTAIQNIVQRYRNATIDEWNRQHNKKSYLSQPSMTSITEITEF